MVLLTGTDCYEVWDKVMVRKNTDSSANRELMRNASAHLIQSRITTTFFLCFVIGYFCPRKKHGIAW